MSASGRVGEGGTGGASILIDERYWLIYLFHVQNDETSPPLTYLLKAKKNLEKQYIGNMNSLVVGGEVGSLTLLSLCL
jgi:hypothetical protein